MSRTFQDRDLLVWEVFPSAGDHGYSERPHLIFNCLTDRLVQPRYIELEGDEAEAERMVIDSTEPQLSALLEQSIYVV